MSTTEEARRLVLKFGEVLAPLVVDEIIKELQEDIYEDSNIEYWYGVKKELTCK